MSRDPAVDQWFAAKHHPQEEPMQRVRVRHVGTALPPRGAKIPGDHPHLDGDGDTARVMRFADLAEVEDRKADLEQVIRDWIAWKS